MDAWHFLQYCPQNASCCFRTIQEQQGLSIFPTMNKRALVKHLREIVLHGLVANVLTLRRRHTKRFLYCWRVFKGKGPKYSLPLNWLGYIRELETSITCSQISIKSLKTLVNFQGKQIYWNIVNYDIFMHEMKQAFFLDTHIGLLVTSYIHTWYSNWWPHWECN